MSRSQILTVVAVLCAVFSGLLLVHFILRANMYRSSSPMRRWSRTTQPHMRPGYPYRQGPATVESRVQVGRLSEATRALETRAQVR